MGVVADTSVFTVSERKRWTANKVASHLSNLFPGETVVISSIGAAELVHGIYRAKTTVQFQERDSYVRVLLAAYPIVPFTDSTAWLAGKLRGEQAQLGNSLPLGDSFIAAAALELDYAILTHNVKDFTRIPDLRVIPFTLS
jgi:tRNA(fMet)-specific endonuclease VapC